ncbi:Uncharacterised protein [Mycobacteroides abscessus subsp. abscessus]|nr:Uncharacterised protein [Mycobacteroides abscessus subsp. abscessus]
MAPLEIPVAWDTARTVTAAGPSCTAMRSVASSRSSTEWMRGRGTYPR